MTCQVNDFLPVEFKKKMKELLGCDYDAFLQSYRQERVHGLRFNTLKGEPDPAFTFCQERFGLTHIPWVREGCYYQPEKRPGKHPLHEAGLYYIQEPSAMAAAVLLDPQPGERILDLCAAPGGKATQIAARLQGRGLLVANENHPARAKILSQNLERMGSGEAVVCNEEPSRLAEYFPEFFDRILVDAPCSGEGMFRKDETAAEQWSEEAVLYCARRQQEILKYAAGMLRPGGRMVYSTCTFSPEEDEGTIRMFLENHSDFEEELLPVPEGISPGRPEWGKGGMAGMAAKTGMMRIWPHLADGEGHFFAVLRKCEGESGKQKFKRPIYVKDQKLLMDFEHFMTRMMKGWKRGTSYLTFGEQLYQVPELMINFDGLKVLRPGLHLGTIKKNRFEPSHALAMHLKPLQVNQWHEMDCDGEDVRKYLAGESLIDTEIRSGWVLMCINGYSIGWSKASGGVLKNHYPKGLRRQA